MTAPLVTKIDHIAINVKSLDAALPFYTQALGVPVDHFETIESQRCRVAFLKIGEVWIELLEPTSPDSPVAKQIEKRGEGLAHLCLETPDIHAAMERLTASGAQLTSREPMPGAHDTLVTFVHPKSNSGVLTELNEYRSRH